MRTLFKKIKDRLFYYFAEKNENIRREYSAYVIEHIEEHKRKRWKHWKVLIRLNWHYRILKRTSALYYSRRAEKKPANPKPAAVKPEVSQPNNSSKGRLPYMKGPESELSKRMLTHQSARGFYPMT